MRTQEQQNALEKIEELTYPVGWDFNKETINKVQRLAKILVPDIEGGKEQHKTQEQIEREEERYRRNNVIVSLSDKGYNNVRIAELMECSPTTVRKALHDWSVG